MKNREFKVRALGEIAIRCRDKKAMTKFYDEVIGLEHLAGDVDDRVTFFKIAEGFGGHTSVLALFRPDEITGTDTSEHQLPQTGAASSLHHIALSLPYEEQQAVMDWYEQIGQDYRVQLFDWIGWRGIFTRDPDGNTVELVAYDPEWSAT
ncbi:glyoxalase [Kiloniella spongiae]|uniref:Glyoxalase n=1 Tax=Kiloniella spongiae TaxID=1489064 RepID=A0A0H2MGW0_9PROT|nr:VOC family protein [Kiloniella spongiae]KLN61396.1 glyoxalase [Kiloniella spongiae]